MSEFHERQRELSRISAIIERSVEMIEQATRALMSLVEAQEALIADGAGLAQIRSYLERAPKPRSMGDAIAIQRTANGQAFPALSDADWERLVRTIYREEKGGVVADFDPALLNTLKGIDLSKPLPTMWPQFMGLAKVPVLAIRGENSRLLSAETLREMAARHPKMEAVTVKGQGHAPLLETAGLPDRIAAFLAKADKN